MRAEFLGLGGLPFGCGLVPGVVDVAYLVPDLAVLSDCLVDLLLYGLACLSPLSFE